jgi:CheY-like chemotaxis protein
MEHLASLVCCSAQRRPEGGRTISAVPDQPLAPSCSRRPTRRRSRLPCVLVVDDSVDVRLLWRVALTLAGFAVREAANGVEAVAKAVADLPDVIVMDLCMPVMSGVEAARTLKGDARTANTPVIGVTAYAGSIVTREFQRVCDEVLQKPVCPDLLVDTLSRAMRSACSAPNETARVFWTDYC